MDSPLGGRDLLALLGMLVALLEITYLRYRLRKGAPRDEEESNESWRKEYYQQYKEAPRQYRKVPRGQGRAPRKRRKETQEMTKRFGKLQVTDELIEHEVDDGEDFINKIWIREFSERDLQRRDSLMIDQGSRRDRRGAPSGQIKLKIENRRKYDLFEGVVEWDFQRPKKAKKRLKPGERPQYLTPEGEVTDDPEKAEAEDIPCTNDEKLNLRGFVSEQIVRHVRELNDLPVEDEDLKEEKDEEKEDPYSDNGADNSAYFDSGDDDEDDNVTPLAKNSRKSQKSKT